MELHQIVALTVFLAVYGVTATRWVDRGAAALVGAAAVAVRWGAGAAVSAVVPEVLLVTTGLMILAGYLRRCGLAAWFALKIAKSGRGRPTWILLYTGVLTFFLGALVGPIAAVTLVVPVTLLLAVELDVAPLPFVVVLTWTSLLGGATFLTAQPGNLWIGAALGIDTVTWFVRIVPFTGIGLLLTLGLAQLVFRKALRVTNERRARVLEYDEARTLGDRPLVVKTVTIVSLVVVGLVAGPFLSLAPSVVALGGAALLILWDGKGAWEKASADVDGATLVFFGALAVVVGALAASGLPSLAARWVPAQPEVALWIAALGGVVFDQGAAAGALTSVASAWKMAGMGNLWLPLALGTSLGAGVTLAGSAAAAAALGLAGSRAPGRKDYFQYAAVFALVNLTAVTGLMLFLGT
jgi:Na+/H+ antiporter NhaD/arsenite permease-like protein